MGSMDCDDAFWEDFLQTGFAQDSAIPLSSPWKLDGGLAANAAPAETSSVPRLLPPSAVLTETITYRSSFLDEDQWPSGTYHLPFIEAKDGFFYDQVCGPAVAEPGGQTLGAADSVALRHPQLNLPSDNQSATASGCDPRKVLTGVSAGTTGSNAISRAPGKRANKPVTDFICAQCTKTKGYICCFNSRKDLRRHKRTTKVHNAPAIARCSCGKTERRKDTKRSHRRSCRGVWTNITT